MSAPAPLGPLQRRIQRLSAETVTPEVTDEPFPWDRTEPYIPPLSASLVIVPGTAIERFDFPSADTGAPVSGLRIGDLTLHTGFADPDALVVIDRLSDALRELRDDIDRRLTIAAVLA